jgi:hypothetical protein
MIMKLPQELIDSVIDYFRDEYWTMRMCSLVCRSWLPPCRRHIFRSVVFYAKCSHHATSYSQRLHSMLLNAPHIASYIQELKMYESNMEYWIGSDQSLPLVLRSLTNLNKIEFRRLCWTSLSLDLKQSITSVLELPSLTFIVIEDGSFVDIDHLLSLLEHTRALTRLSLTGISTLNPDPLMHKDRGATEQEQERSEILHQQSSLVHLRLAMRNYPLFVRWLLGPRSAFEVSHIHTLHIPDYHLSDALATNRLLRAIGNSLIHIQLCVPYDISSQRAQPHLICEIQFLLSTPPDESPVDIDFQYNSGITSLFLEGIKMQDIKSRWNPFPWLIRLLSNISKTNPLQEIELDVRAPDVVDRPVDLSVWTEVDRALAGTRPECHLQKVDIWLWWGCGGDVTTQLMRRTRKDLVLLFPLLTARGVSVNGGG